MRIERGSELEARYRVVGVIDMMGSDGGGQGIVEDKGRVDCCNLGKSSLPRHREPAI